MTIHGSLGHFSVLPRMKLIMLLKDLSKLFRMRRTAVFLQLNRIIEKNFRMRSLTDSAVNWVLDTTSQHQELHNRMELKKGRIGPWRHLLEQC